VIAARAPWIAAVALLVAACGSPSTVPTPSAPAVVTTQAAAPTPSSTPVTTPIATATPAPKFPPGLYVMRPSSEAPGGQIELIGGTLTQSVQIKSIAFDVSADAVVWGENDTLVVARADGKMERIVIKGLYSMGRPSLSPDGQRVIVQATEEVVVPGATQAPQGAVAHLDTAYVVDLKTGTWRRVGPVPTSPSTQSEMPVFFPSGDRVAYWLPDTEQRCLVIKVHDATTLAEVLTIRDRGTTGCYVPKPGGGARFHFAVSRDSSRIVISAQLQIYDAKTGALVADVRQAALDGLAAAGYKIDTRFPGAQNRGLYPIAASFSPDGKQIAFDGSVEKDGAYGMILCRINVDGSGFTVLRAPVPVPMPRFSNNLNFSPLWPQWR